MSDAINPAHYKRLPAEAIQIIEAAIDGAPSNKDAYLHGQILKYILRCWNKNGIEDLKKAKWYLDRLIHSFEANEPVEQAKAQLNSDKIPQGYRKLGDSSIEPRDLEDLRWSVSEKRYVEITVDEIGYANRDNWAACRKIEPVVKKSLTPEPPDGWRWLERGEVIRKGDRCFSGDQWKDRKWAIEEMYSIIHQKTIRRNRFEVGEKVIVKDNTEIWEVDSIVNGVYQLKNNQCRFASFPEHLAPYIEDAK
jgi:hypothetical protein